MSYPDPTERAALALVAAERDALKARVADLEAGGCARDQGTTQFCAEAAAVQTERYALRAQLYKARGLLTELRCEFAPTLDDERLNYVEGQISRAYLKGVDAWLASQGLDNPAAGEEVKE